MTLLRGADEVIVGDLEPAPHLEPLRHHPVDPFLRRDALLGRGACATLRLCSSVPVRKCTRLPLERWSRTAEHVAGDDLVGRPNVWFRVHVRDRRCDVEDVLAHGRAMVAEALERPGSVRGVERSPRGARRSGRRSRHGPSPSSRKPARSPRPQSTTTGIGLISWNGSRMWASPPPCGRARAGPPLPPTGRGRTPPRAARSR